MAKTVSVATEHRLRYALSAAVEGVMAGNELSVRLRAAAPVSLSRDATYMMIGNATTCGLLLRSGTAGNHVAGKPKGYSYRINPDWQRDAVRAKRAHASDTARRPSGNSLAYNGPAFDCNALTPAIGPRPADPEVMPPEIADMIDSLHQRCYRHAHGVEA